jgi:ParB-like chromosome segregation protein Spo0J
MNMTIEAICPDAIEIGSRQRTINQSKVDGLAKSMSELGLQNPISVWSPDGEVIHLVAGLHRIEAAKSLGWDQVSCIFVKMDKIDRELWEIDENLCRAELSPTEESEHLARREELWKAMKERKLTDIPKIFDRRVSSEESGTDCSALVTTGRGNEQFAAETAAVTGQSKQDINRKTARAKAIAPDIMEEIKGTSMDKGVELDALKGLTDDEQRQAVDRVKDRGGTIRDAREFLRGDKEESAKMATQKQKKALTRAWGAADQQVRRWFLEKFVGRSAVEK